MIELWATGVTGMPLIPEGKYYPPKPKETPNMINPSNSKEPHVHKYDKPATKTIILTKYRKEDGKMKDVAISGKDVIKQFKCECGKTLATDLERVKT